MAEAYLATRGGVGFRIYRADTARAAYQALFLDEHAGLLGNAGVCIAACAHADCLFHRRHAFFGGTVIERTPTHERRGGFTVTWATAQALAEAELVAFFQAVGTFALQALPVRSITRSSP